MNYIFDDPKKFLVKFKNTSKVIRIIETSELLEAIEESFAGCPVNLPSEFMLQYWDEEFQEFVDLALNNTEVLLKANRLNVVDFQPSLSSTVQENATLLSDCSDAGDDQIIETPETSNSADSVAPHDISSFEEESSVVSKKSIWPQPFILKDDVIPPSVLKKLNSKTDLNPGSLTALFSCLFEQCTKITYLPQPWQYDDMVHAILSRWKHLMRHYPTERDAKWDLKKKMRNFFKNTRKRKCTHVPEVEVSKQKFKKKTAVTISNVWGVKNFLPKIDEGEDERTITLHIQKMKEQYLLHPYKRKMSIVDIGMRKTLSKRRDMIVSGELSVLDIIDEFPFLGEGHQILREFERTTELSLENKWDEYFSKFAPAILKLRAAKSSKVEILETEIGKLEDDSDGSVISLAVLLLPSLLREDATIMFENFGIKNHPQILGVGNVNSLVDIKNADEFKVNVDGVKIGQTGDFAAAMQLLFSAFYVFNLAYPKGLNGTLLFLQKEVMSIHDSSPPIAKVINLITKLNKSEIFNKC